MKEYHKKDTEKREFIKTIDGKDIDRESAEKLEGYNPGFGFTEQEMDEMIKDIPFTKVVEDIPIEEDAKFYANYIKSNIPDRMKLLEFDKREILSPRGPIVYAEGESEDEKEYKMGDQERFDFLPKHKRNMIKTDVKDIKWDKKLNMYVHDVMVPEKLEKFFLDPYGVHNKRDEKAEKIIGRMKKKDEAKEKEDKLPKYRSTQSINGPTIRQQRVCQLLWEGCQEVIEKDFKTEKMGGLTVNKVRITRNLAHAKLFWTCNPQYQKELDLFLKKSSRLFRYFLTQRISIKRSPNMEFVYEADTSMMEDYKLKKFRENTVIKQIKKEEDLEEEEKNSF